MALGAPPARVVGLMLRRGMAPVLAGLAVGIPLALLATRLLRSLLYEVSASDPVTFVGVAALLAAVALVALARSLRTGYRRLSGLLARRMGARAALRPSHERPARGLHARLV